MAKKLTAAQRTLIHPAIDMHETPQPEAYVKPAPGPALRRAPGGYPPAVHYFEPGNMRSLCGVLTLAPTTRGRPEPTSGYGTCADCRNEASSRHAVVR